ncbi:hypothetical protein M422DRAFT_243253 [Sphaerobolus stellatus SS14]|nr:hypothetical protein M422DRAFT_243253 [Sphaerobolus stellatus SS14]
MSNHPLPVPTSPAHTISCNNVSPGLNANKNPGFKANKNPGFNANMNPGSNANINPCFNAFANIGSNANMNFGSNAITSIGSNASTSNSSNASTSNSSNANMNFGSNANTNFDSNANMNISSNANTNFSSNVNTILRSNADMNLCPNANINPNACPSSTSDSEFSSLSNDQKLLVLKRILSSSPTMPVLRKLAPLHSDLAVSVNGIRLSKAQLLASFQTHCCIDDCKVQISDAVATGISLRLHLLPLSVVWVPGPAFAVPW